MKKIYIYIMIVVTLNIRLIAGSINNSIPILDMDSMGARQIGLGDTFTGIADDINTITVNPSGMVFIEKKSVDLMYMNYFEDFVFGNIAMGYPLKKGINSIGLEIGYFSMGEFNSYDSVGNTGNSIASGDILIGVSYADKILRYFNVNKDFSTGVSVKYIKSKLDDSDINILAGDFGVIYKMTVISLGKKKVNNFSIGGAVQNIGILNSSSIAIPTKYRFGFGYNIYKDKKNNILLGSDVIFYADSNIGSTAGMEYKFMNMVSIRAGYKMSGVDTGKLTIGMGVRYNISGYDIHIDYGNILMSDLGNTHIFSIGMKM